jgi:hypothetical protein
MLRYLTAALFCEGREDERFLVEVIGRQVGELGLSEPGFVAGAVVPQRCRTVREAGQVDAAVLEAAADFDLLLVHHDHNERGKAEALRTRLADRVAKSNRIVPVIPVRETEAWMLADPDALPRGSVLDQVPERPDAAESIPDPKKPLAAALGRPLTEKHAELIGETISLDRLARLPSYQAFLQDLTTALKELTFL